MGCERKKKRYGNSNKKSSTMPTLLIFSAKTQFRGIIEQNVNAGLYDMDYIMDNQLYLPGLLCLLSSLWVSFQFDSNCVLNLLFFGSTGLYLFVSL